MIPESVEVLKTANLVEKGPEELRIKTNVPAAEIEVSSESIQELRDHLRWRGRGLELAEREPVDLHRLRARLREHFRRDSNERAYRLNGVECRAVK